MATLSHPHGRMLCFEQWGDPDGSPLFFLHGTPGCRLSRHPDGALWPSLHLRVIMVDRPGYGGSTPLPGRGISHAAHDVAAVADALGLERFIVAGSSGGGPHALASAAPLVQRELGELIGLNRESDRVLGQDGRAGMVRFLGELRERILADPATALRSQLADVAPADLEWEARQDVQAVRREALIEALRPSVEGWVDDAVSLFGEEWNVDLRAIACPVRFWHSDDDRNGPLSAGQRIVDQVPDASLQIWRAAGHSAPSRFMPDVLSELISVAI